MALRLDRVGSIYLASGIMPFIPLGKPAIPILMYHSILEEDESHIHPYYRLATSPTIFLAQMEYLKSQGYTTCNLREASALTRSATVPTEKYVAITFDDGYRSIFREAFPILQRFGFTGTVFLPTGYIGEQTVKFNARSCLNWSEVRELQKYGMVIGSHTVSHPQLQNLSRRTVEEEVVNSKDTIEQKISAAVDSFAYPYAFPQDDKAFQSTMRDVLRNAGYTHGVCTTVGRAGPQSEPLFLPRLPMNGADERDLLHAKLIGAYSWVGWLQSTRKNLAANRRR